VIDRDVSIDGRLELERDVPQRLVLLGLDVSSVQEPILGDLDALATVDLFDADHGESDVQDPLVHDPRHVDTGSLGDTSPEILGRCVAVQVLFQVDRHALEELVLTDDGGEHSEDRSSLRVRDRIEDLVDLVGVGAGDLDRMGRSDGVEGQGGHQVGRQKFLRCGRQDCQCHAGSTVASPARARLTLRTLNSGKILSGMMTSP